MQMMQLLLFHSTLEKNKKMLLGKYNMGFILFAYFKEIQISQYHI